MVKVLDRIEQLKGFLSIAVDKKLIKEDDIETIELYCIENSMSFSDYVREKKLFDDTTMAKLKDEYIEQTNNLVTEAINYNYDVLQKKGRANKKTKFSENEIIIKKVNILPQQHTGNYRIEDVQKIFPNMEIKRKIGAGGMGEVFLGVINDNEYAIKLVRDAGKKNKHAKTRFRREIHALKMFKNKKHDNIVGFQHFYLKNDPMLFIMDYIEGPNLQQHIKQKDNYIFGTEREVVSFVLKIAKALAYVHDFKLVHRDVKPANIFLDEKNNLNPVLGDFGLVSYMEQEYVLPSITQGIVGSVEFLAPEQIKLKKITPQADIYSLALVMYYMLTGVNPYVSGTGKMAIKLDKIDAKIKDVSDYKKGVLNAKLNLTPTPVHKLNPLISEELSKMISICLNIDPEERLESMTSMVHYLELFLQDKTINIVLIEKNKNFFYKAKKFFKEIHSAIWFFFLISCIALFLGFAAHKNKEEMKIKKALDLKKEELVKATSKSDELTTKLKTVNSEYNKIYNSQTLFMKHNNKLMEEKNKIEKAKREAERKLKISQKKQEEYKKYKKELFSLKLKKYIKGIKYFSKKRRIDRAIKYAKRSVSLIKELKQEKKYAKIFYMYGTLIYRYYKKRNPFLWKEKYAEVALETFLNSKKYGYKHRFLKRYIKICRRYVKK